MRFTDLPPLPNPFAPRAEEAPAPKFVMKMNDDGYERIDWPATQASMSFEDLQKLAPGYPGQIGSYESFRFIGPKCLPSPKRDDSYISFLEKAYEEKDELIKNWQHGCDLRDGYLQEMARKIQELKLELAKCAPSCHIKPAAETIFVSGVYEQFFAKKESTRVLGTGAGSYFEPNPWNKL